MKKFISIIAAAACLATCASFTACGDGETSSDIVTEEEWIAAFATENFANVSVDRAFSQDYAYSANNGGFTTVYYDADQYQKETGKKSVKSTVKIDTEYSEETFAIDSSYPYYDYLDSYTYTDSGYSGNLSMDGEYTYEWTYDYNYTDVEVLKEALGENYFYWPLYTETYVDSQGSESQEISYKDYYQYELVEKEDSFSSKCYSAEQSTEDGTAGEWQYFSKSSVNFSDSVNPIKIAFGTCFNYSGEGIYWHDFSRSTADWNTNTELAALFDSVAYDEKSGAYVYTYRVNEELTEDQLRYLEGNGYEYSYVNEYSSTYYIKINDGYVSSVKEVIDVVYDYSYTSNLGTYYEKYEINTVYEFNYYDYGVTTVEVPDEIETELTALKEENW